MLTSEQFKRETRYCAALALAKRLLKQGAITEGEYNRIHKMLTRKYQPVISLL